MTLLLEGKRAFVSGGTRGIGAAICEVFAREGANVAFNYYSSDDLAEEVKAKILESVGKPIPYFIQILFSEVHKTYFQDEEEITEETIEKIYRDKVLGVDCKTYFEHYYGRLRIYYEPNEEKATKKILREIAVAGNLSKEFCFQIYQKAIGKKAELERFGSLMTELENDFYVVFNSEKNAYEFGSKLLRDWWLRYYGMTID